MPDDIYAATQHLMRGRFTSLLIFFALLFSVAVAPVVAHATDHEAAQASEMFDIHEIDKADQKHSKGADKDMPCHAVSHHHCSAALPFDAPRLGMSGLAKAMLVRPGATAPLISRSQAPPLDPPLA